MHTYLIIQDFFKHIISVLSFWKFGFIFSKFKQFLKFYINEKIPEKKLPPRIEKIFPLAPPPPKKKTRLIPSISSLGRWYG